MANDEEVWEEVCSKIPSDTDILITHGPPLGIQDANLEGNRCGSEIIRRHVVERVQPKYHIFGHIHESYGIARYGQTIFANAASCTRSHGSLNPPIVLDTERRGFKETFLNANVGTPNRHVCCQIL